MKRNKGGLSGRFFLVACIGLGLAILNVNAQTLSQSSASTAGATGQNLPAPTEYQITKQGGNHRVWERTIYERSPSGEAVPKKRSYTELATGMYYRKNGQWVESREQIDILPDGSAAATQGQHQVYFPADIYNGVIEIVTPDGKHLQGRPLGVSYDDGNQTVFISELKHSVGQLVGTNRIVYRDAFTDFKADLVCTYRRSGFECDLVFREQPPAPDIYGLNTAASTLQLVTEFFDTPEPHQQTAEADEGTDATLRFGQLTMGRGKAFATDAGNNARSPRGNKSVSKTWMHLQNRTLLIEQLPFSAIKPDLEALPAPADGTSGKIKSDPALHVVSTKRILPPPHLAAFSTNSIRVASNESLKTKGVVLDYTTIIANETNYTFQGDSTYFVSGEYNLLGTTTIEGGAVIKMNGSGQIDIDQNGTVVCQTGSYHPGLFTSMNDDTTAQQISGSSGNPNFNDVEIFLNINATNVILHDLRFSYAVEAIQQNPSPAMVDLWNCQFANIDISVYAYNVGLHNVLIGHPAFIFDASIYLDGPSLVAENVTVDDYWYFMEAEHTGATVALTNCLGTCQYLVSPGGYSVALQTNAVVRLPQASAAYQTIGGGSYYLTNGSPYHNAGTTNISPALLAQFATKTTYPPLVYSNATFSIATNLSPRAQRDDVGNPDIGYHYDPLDYVFGGVTAHSNLTFTAGTAVGWFNGSSGCGITLYGTALASFNGTATAPCVFAKSDTVQEGGNGYWTAGGYLGGFIGLGGNYTAATAPRVNLQFTHCYSRNFEGGMFRDSGDGTLLVVQANNSEFYDAPAGGYLVYMYCTNCLFERVGAGVGCDCSPSLAVVNCTFIGGSLSGNRWDSWNTWPVVVKNCAFDGTDLSSINDTSGGNTNITYCDFNAFLTNGSLTPILGAHSVTNLASFYWQSSWLGDHYLTNTSPLINRGSATADKIGLYHFTVQTNQVPETNSVVDIGYHYVATDAFGNPLDNNGDGIPDYVSDANGNGLDDSAETPWDVSILTQPASQVANWGGTAVFTVMAGGNLPLGYQWKVNGTNISGATFATYSKTNLTFADAGNYSVAVTSTTGFTLTSSNAILSVKGRYGYWRFDNTNTWVGDEGQLPTTATNLSGVPSWITNAVRINSTSAAALRYHFVETNGNANLALSSGTIRFWLKPDWSSTNAGGAGPGTMGRLIEAGNYNPAFTNGWWALYTSADGSHLSFGSSTNGHGITNLTASVAWTSNSWHQIALTYSTTNCILYFDGSQVANGSGVTYCPNVGELTNGFGIGSDPSGSNQIKGAFDELETFNYPLTAGTIASNYETAVTWDEAGGGLPNAWQLANFGHLGVDPSGDPDGDGLSNLEEYQNDTNPNQFNAARLGYWQFDDPPNWLETAGLAPNIVNGLFPVTSWNGDAVMMLPNQNGALGYPGVRSNGSVVTLCPARTGTIRFWFKPQWRTALTGGVGPQDTIRLFEIGRESTNATYGWFAVTVNPLGTSLTFSTEGSGSHTNNAVYPISFTTNNWYQIALTFTATNSCFYVNGIRSTTNGLGLSVLPGPEVIHQGFTVGCSWDGAHQANGCFDELETFNYPLTAQAISATYNSLASRDTYGTGLPDVVKNAWGLNPTAIDSDCDGLPDAWKLANGLNPNDPSVATSNAFAAYESGGNVFALNYNLTTDPTNIVNVAFVSDAGSSGGATIGGALVLGGDTDSWNFCDIHSDYSGNGVPLHDATNTATGARLFAYIGPCTNSFFNYPNSGDYTTYTATSTNGAGDPLYEDHRFLNCDLYDVFRSQSFLKAINLYDIILGLSMDSSGKYSTVYLSWPYWGEHLTGDTGEAYTSYNPDICLYQNFNPHNYDFYKTQLDPGIPLSDDSDYIYSVTNLNGFGLALPNAEELSDLQSSISDSDAYAGNLASYIESHGFDHTNYGNYVVRVINDNSTIYTNRVFQPTGCANCFIPPYASVSHNTNDLLGSDGAIWRYSGASLDRSGGVFKLLYPNTKRTVLITGLPVGSYSVYIYYDSLVQPAPAIVNNLASTALSTPQGVKYWYCGAYTAQFPGQTNMSECLNSRFPVWMATNAPGRGYLEVTVDSPRVYNSTADLKILGMQIVANSNLVTVTPTLQIRPGLNTNYLTWTPSATATNYLIWRSAWGTNSWGDSPYAQTTNTFFRDNGAESGVFYYYSVNGVGPGGTNETASSFVGTASFGCATPLPPRLDYVNQLQCQIMNNCYELDYQKMLANSDADDPQGRPMVFKVDSVVSGSLMIDGQPFSGGNNTIGAASSVVWAPPPVAVANGTPAFRTYVFDGINRSSNLVNVLIRQQAPTHVFAWGNDTAGEDGAGCLGTGLLEGDGTNNLTDWSGNPLFGFQNLFGIYPYESSWQVESNMYCHWLGVPIKQMPDFGGVSAISTFGWNDNGHCSVTSDGHLWFWGDCDASVIGNPLVVNDMATPYQTNTWDYSNAALRDFNWLPLDVTLLTPVPVQDSQTHQPMTGVKIAKDIFVVKQDGSLWSFGLGGDQLGRNLFDSSDPTTDLFDENDTGPLGMIPRRVAIAGNNDTDGVIPGRGIVELNTAGENWGYGGFALARCEDGSLWAWGYMFDQGSGGYFVTNIITCNYTDPVVPTELVNVESASSSPIAQISESWNHIIMLRGDGSLSEFGYIPEYDSARLTTNYGAGFDGDYVPIKMISTDYHQCYRATPIAVTNTPANIRQVCSGPAFGAVLTGSGNVYVWGQWLGEVLPYPQLIPSLSGITKIAVGSQCIIALDQQGHLWGVGLNQDGAFGFNDLSPGSVTLTGGNTYNNLPIETGTIYRHSAVQIPGIENAVDIYAGDTTWTWKAQVYAVGTTVQGKPVGLSATPMNQEVGLVWSNYPAASSYNIYRSLNANAGFVPIGTAPVNSFLDQSAALQNGQTYFYEVSAMVNGVETLPSWDVAAIPYPSPTAVQSPIGSHTCQGVKLQWLAPSNALASPLQEYVILRDSVQLTQLFPNVTNYYDDTAVSNSTYSYSIIARNSSGQAATNVVVDGTSPSIPCNIAPEVNTNGPYSWLTVAPKNSGHDLASLVWEAPLTNIIGASTWLFQSYEFGAQSSSVGGFINLLKFNPDTNVVAGWVWSQFYASESNTLTDANAPVGSQMQTLVTALNRIITDGQSVSNNSMFVAAMQAGRFDNAATPRAETTNLFNTYPTGTNLMQLKRMLLGDYFSYPAPGYFTRAPNWGDHLTGFRIHYRTVQYADGIKLTHAYQQDVGLNSVSNNFSLLWPDNSGLSWPLYEYSWSIPQGSVCWASVSALIDGQESDISAEAGPKSAASGFTWNASLQGVPGYQQVYLDWADSPEISSFDVYYTTTPTTSGQCDSGDWTNLASGLQVNCCWQTNLPPGTYYYKVVANRVNGLTAKSCESADPIAITVTTNAPAPPTNLFSAYATPYDSMVLVEWTVPTNLLTVPFNPFTQTNWQFYVERKNDGTGDANYQVVSSVGYGLAYLDSDVADSQTYNYRVTAFDLNFNRLQTNAVLVGGSSPQITPSATNNLTLLPPVPGNGYVDLTWTPMRATQFTVEHSLSPQGPFTIDGINNAASAYENAANSYRDTGAQNGVTNYYQIAATTPTGFVVNSAVQGAVPLATLTPLPPNNFRGEFLPDTNNGKILLTWNAGSGVSGYQVFLRDRTSFTPLYNASSPSCLYPIPDGATNDAVFTFDLRALSASAPASGFAEITVTNEHSISAAAGLTNPIMLQVAGSYGPNYTMTGPTNLALNAVVNLTDVSGVSFYADGRLIGTVDTPPYLMTWFHVPGGTHYLTATALITDSTGHQNTISSPDNWVTVSIAPILSAYQASATDLQLPAPGLPVSLTRSYTSRNTNVVGSLGMGWSASWYGGTLSLSAALGSGWIGAYEYSWASRAEYYVSDSSGHSATVSLPDGENISFAPQLSGADYPASYAEYYDPSILGTTVKMKLQPFDPSQGSLKAAGLNNLEVDQSGGWDSTTWVGDAITLPVGTPSSFTYTATDGTKDVFGLQGANSLTWLLTQIVDRNSNTLTYAYNSDYTVQSISNSCGRCVNFAYASPQNGTTNISVYDPVGGTGGVPVLVYVVITNRLAEVHKLISRSSGLYETNWFLYGTNSSGAPYDVNRLTDAFDARGIRLVHNAYTNDPSGLAGDVMIQITGNRTNTFAVDSANDVTVTTSTSTSSATVKVTSDLSGAITGATQPTNGPNAAPALATQNTYDDQGRLVAQTDASGNVKTFTYDSQNRLIGQSDAAGHTTSQTLNALGEPLVSTDANGNSTSHSYDTQGNPLTVTDPSGTVTTYGYTNFGLVTSESQAAPLVFYTNLTQYTYTPAGDQARVVQGWMDGGNNYVGMSVTNSYTCDANGNRTSEVKTRSVPGGTQTIVTTNLYDAQGRLVTTIISASGAQTFAPQTNTIIYNQLGKQATNIDAAGRVTTSIYDYNGNLIETEYPDGIAVSRTVYDALGRTLYTQDRAVTNSSGLSIAPATRNVYDASGRVVKTDRLASLTLQLATASTNGDYVAFGSAAAQSKMSAPNAGDQLATNLLTTTLTFYDALGNVQYTVSPRGLVTQNQYDANNRVTSSKAFPSYCYWNDMTLGGTDIPNPTGTSLSTAYTYDANGNQVTVTDAAGHTTTSVYDDSDRVIEVLPPASLGGTTAKFTYYDGLGRKIQETDEAGVNTAYSYDFRGLLTSVTLAAGTTQQVTTVYQYDEVGNEIKQTDAAGHTTTFQYDALGRRIGRTLPGSQSESMGYDLAGNLIYQMNFNGVIITNQYDMASRLTNQTSVNGYHVSYAYSPTGLRTNMVDMSGITAYFYNAMGQLTNKVVSWTNGPVLGLNYGYDPFSVLTNLYSSSSSGVSNAYQYDLLGRLTNVLANGSVAAGYQFDAVGNLQTLAYGNGVTNLYQYDSLNRLTNLVWKASSTALASFAYTLGVTGNRTNLTETVNGINRTNNWAYDYLYRLTGETIGTASSLGALGYGFDAVGNRTSRSSTILQIPTNATSYTANDWLTSDNYDPNGNTTNSGTIAYQYDALNHLTNASNGAILIAYDGDGNRVRKTVGGTNTYYLVDDRNPSGYAQVLEEWTAIGTATNLSCVYNYGMNLISQRQVASGTVNYYGADGHGSTRFLLNTSGGITDTYAYDAYGMLAASNGTTVNCYLYCGQQYDSDLGFYYLRARYYKPDSGRFWTMDTDQGDNNNPISLHKYLYCQGNPVSETDPLGLWATIPGFPIHQMAIDQELNFLPESDRSVLRDEQSVVDTHQDASDSYMHAMRDGDQGQTVESAKSMANFFVKTHIYNARRAQLKGNRAKAMSELGQAMHTLQDSTSPMHHGFKPWYDYFGGAFNPAEIAHGAREAINPGPGSWLYKATHSAYDYFCKGRMPDDVFANLGGDTVGNEIVALVKRKASSVAQFQGDMIERGGFPIFSGE